MQKFTHEDIPDDYKDKSDSYREKIETVVELDDTIMEKYLDGTIPSTDQIKILLEKGQ